MMDSSDLYDIKRLLDATDQECDVCGHDGVELKIGTRDCLYRGYSGTVQCVYISCPSCCEYVGSDQIDYNASQTREFMDKAHNAYKGNSKEQSESYLVFLGETYYARGGVHDLAGSYSTLEEAEKYAQGEYDNHAWDGADWYHIVNSVTRLIVSASENQGLGAEDIEGGYTSS